MYIMTINKNDVEMEDIIKYSELVMIHKGMVSARGLDKYHAKILWAGMFNLRLELSGIRDKDLFYRYSLALTSIETDLLIQIGGYQI